MCCKPVLSKMQETRDPNLTYNSWIWMCNRLHSSRRETYFRKVQKINQIDLHFMILQTKFCVGTNYTCFFSHYLWLVEGTIFLVAVISIAGISGVLFVVGISFWATWTFLSPLRTLSASIKASLNKYNSWYSLCRYFLLTLNFEHRCCECELCTTKKINGWYLAELCMRSSRATRASDWQSQSSNSSVFDPSILRHSGIRGMVDEEVFNNERKKRKKIPLLQEKINGPGQNRTLSCI